MNDVARLAGVSHQTVSRVLNDHPNVREATRAKVLAAISELGYRRNSAARALVTHRSATIGIVTSGSMLFGPASTLAVLEQTARASGFFVSVATAPRPTPELMAEIFGSFMDQSVEGIVVIAPVVEVADAARAVSADVPVLMISALDRSAGDPPTVSVDQVEGARIAARHLLELGHRDVVQVTGPAGWFDAQDRIRGWRDELATAGIEPRPDIGGDWGADAGFEAARFLRADLPTAVFAANDMMALGMLHAFAEGGVRVPQDVSVIGFDAVVGSDHFHPPLTTVRQDFDALAQVAVQALLAALEGETATLDPITPVLVRRESTGPPRTA